VGRYANAGFLGRLARELGQTKAYAASPDRPINGGHRDADASGVCRFAVVVYAENLRRAVRIVKDSCPGSAVAIAFRIEPIQFFAAGPAPTDMTIPKASEKLGSGVGATAARLVRRRFLGLY
jgi:hypothetical protein